MEDSPEKFFEDLAARRMEPLLQDASGVLQVELLDDGRKQDWYLKIDRGEMDVSRKKVKADCLVQLSRDEFEQALRGKRNLIAAALRGTAQISGKATLALQFQRLLPGPPPAAKARPRRRRAA